MAKHSEPKRLKIGIVFDDTLDNPDGVQQYILSVGNWLKSQGHTVHYLVGQTSRTDIENVHSLARNFAVTFNGNKLSIPLPTSKRKLRKLLEQERYDILHVQMPYSPWLAHRIISAAPTETTVFGTFHIVAYSRFVKFATKLLAVWTRRSLRRFSDIVSVSSAAQLYALETYGVKTDVLPNVFEYSRFNQAKPLLPSEDSKKRILFLGRLVERKGCQYLLEAVRTLQQKGLTEYTVTICGKGHLSSSLQEYAKRYDLPVTFAGFVSEDDKPGYYASADIAVFPSTGGESFGIVLVEAMASGNAAVIGANNSGYASVLHERPDLIFPIADATGIADTLELLLTHEDARHDAARWGEEYSRQFDAAVVGKKLILRYEHSIERLHQTDRQ